MFSFFVLNRMIKNLHIYFSMLFLFTCCAGVHSIYENNFPLSNKSITSSIGRYSINIPNGWREIEANGEAFADIWIVNESDELSIIFTPVTANIALSEVRGKQSNNLEPLLHIYIESLFKDKSVNKFYEEFELAQISFKAIEIRINDERERFVIFKQNNSYSIVRAVANSKNPNYEYLFKVQNSVLASIKSVQK